MSSVKSYFNFSEKIKRVMEKILLRMREIIMTIDLDNASCLEIRKQLESDFNVNLTPYKRFIDEQVFVFVKQGL